MRTEPTDCAGDAATPKTHTCHVRNLVSYSCTATWQIFMQSYECMKINKARNQVIRLLEMKM
jgi:hypothetical protein